MTTTRKLWTIEEDQYLIDHLKSYSYNLQKGFLIASQHLNRTSTAISCRWYTKLSKQTPIFMVASSKKATINRKNSENTIRSNNSIWNKIKRLFKL